MNERIIVKLGWIGLLCGLLIACGSSIPTRYYVLTPLPAKDTGVLPKPNYTLGLGPITIANYLDQTPIVTRQAHNQLHIASFHYWTGSLAQNIKQVMNVNLDNLLPRANVINYPWSGAIKFKYRIPVDIIRFDTDQNFTSVLEARWQILSSDGSQVLRSESQTYSIQLTAGSDYELIARAMSANLNHLSEDIAASVPLK